MKLTKFFLIGVVAAMTSVSTAAAQNTHWVGTWSASEVGRPQTPGAAAGPPPAIQGTPCPAVPVQSSFIHFNNQTLRQIVHTSLGGSTLRVVLSNAYGTAPLTIGAAHVALRERGASIQKSSGRTLTFSGRPTIVRLSMTCPRPEVPLRSSGASALTVTDSEMLPSSS